MSWAHEDYYKSFIDDLNQAKNGEMAVVKEEEENDANDDVFDMSQVEWFHQAQGTRRMSSTGMQKSES